MQFNKNKKVLMMKMFDKKGRALFFKNPRGRFSRFCIDRFNMNPRMFNPTVVWVWVHKSLLKKYGYHTNEMVLPDMDCIQEAIRNNGYPSLYDRKGQYIKKTRTSLEDKKEVIHGLLQADKSIREISKMLNCSYNAVFKRVNDWGFTSSHASLFQRSGQEKHAA